MKLNNLIKLRNWFYFIQGKYRGFIIREYERIASDDTISSAIRKAATCPDCYHNGTCLVCECDFEDMILSDKPCPKGKF